MRHHLCADGVFEVRRASDGMLHLIHLPSFSQSGRFSHLAIRTIKAAQAGVDRSWNEGLTPRDQSMLRGLPLSNSGAWETAIGHWAEALRSAFPNGGWAR